jgi:putative acetyltransferase
VLIRRERPADLRAIQAVHTSAFGDPARPNSTAPEVGLVDALRISDAWLPELSLVAEGMKGPVVGHVLCSRGWVDGVPALGLGPLGVRADQQRQGVGTALMYAVLGAADALGEPFVALVGDLGYYRRFGFRPARDYGIRAPVAGWEAEFQIRVLSGYVGTARGTFTYAAPFSEL